MHTIEELQEKQALPLDLKVSLTKTRIRAWVHQFGEDGVYVSFSGGKDSTVLLDIARKMYPNIKAVYVDTGLEYPEIREFVKTYENVDIVKPNMNFKEVIRRYGYPFISKEVSQKVYEYKPDGYAEKYFIPEDRGGKKAQYNYSKWKFLLDAPFQISNRCCNVMKKNTVKKYEKTSGRNAITAQMASESLLRTTQWLKNGCNMFDSKHPISNPMSFWTEQDVLLYIRMNNLEIASVYGDVVTEDERSGQITIADLVGAEQKGIFELDRPTLCTTGCSRTGCVFCMYGAHLEKRPNRLETMLQVTNPNLYDYMMRGGAFVDGNWEPTSDGLGFWFPIAWINSHSTIRYYAPNLEKYMKEYGTEETRRYLEEK